MLSTGVTSGGTRRSFLSGLMVVERSRDIEQLLEVEC